MQESVRPNLLVPNTFGCRSGVHASEWANQSERRTLLPRAMDDNRNHTLGMKLQQLAALVAVVEHGSIREAARQLHLSQAAVTKSMRLLEEEAGVPLLMRRSRGVDLTEAGRRLVARARVVTRQVALAREDLSNIGGDDAGTLRVGVTPFVTLTVLGETFNWFRQRYRKVQVEFTDGLMLRVMPRLRDGSLDLALVAMDHGEKLGEEFHAEGLRSIRQRVVVRHGHPVLSNPTPQALMEYEWIFTRPMSVDRSSRMVEVFARAGVAPPKRFIVSDALHEHCMPLRCNVDRMLSTACQNRRSARRKPVASWQSKTAPSCRLISN